MRFLFTPAILPLALTTVMIAGLCINLWHKRTAPGALPLIVLLLAVGEWTASYCLELLGADLPTKQFWAQIEYFGILPLPLAWLHFSIRFSDRHRKRTYRPWLVSLLLAVPLIALLMVWTPGLQKLIWVRQVLIVSGPFLTMQSTFGVGFWLLAVYTYAIFLYGSYLLLKSALHSQQWYRKQIMAILVAVIVPWVGNVLYLAHLTPWPGVDLSPFGFAISGLALSWGILGHKMMELLPIARATVIEHMQSAVIVLDEADRVVDLNLAAAGLFWEQSEPWLGAPFHTFSLVWPELAIAVPDDFSTEYQGVICRNVEGSLRWYDLRLSILYDKMDSAIGRLILLLDITVSHQAREKLRQAEDRYRDLVENSHDLICTHDLDGYLLSINQFALDTLGFSNEELVGKNLRELLSKEMSQGIDDYLAAIQANGAARGTLKIRTRSGETRIWEYDNTLRTEGVERPVVRGIARDITEEHQTKKELQRHLQEITTLHAVSLAGVQATDEDTLIENATRIIGESLYPDNFGFMLLDRDRGVLRFHPSYRGVSQEFKATCIPLGEGVTGQVAADGKPRYIADVTSVPEFIPSSEGLRSEICVPLKVSGQVIGVINAESRSTRAFRPEDERLLITFASQLSTAMAKLGLLEMERQQAGLLSRTNALISALSSVATKMEATHVPDRVLAVLGEELTAIGFHCLVALSEPESHEFAFHYSSLPDKAAQLFERLGRVHMSQNRFLPERMALPGKHIEEIQLMTLRDGASILAQVLPGFTLQVVERILQKIKLLEDTLVMHLPLSVEGKLLGVLWLMGIDLQKSDLPAMNIFARQTAVALENARLYAAERQRSQELEALRQASLSLTSSLELPVVLENILAHTIRLLQANNGSIFLYDGEHLTFGAALWADGQVREVLPPRPGGLTYSVARGAEAIIIPDANKHPFYQNWQWGGAIIGYPLKIGEQVRGVMNIAVNRPHHFNDNELRTLRLLADQAALALENARLFEETQRLATTDGLTGLHTRRYFFKLAEAEFVRSLRFERPIAALMLDADHFKQINDKYGHAIGDEALRAIGKCLRDDVRTIDIVGRYGGEEFVLILPEVDLPAALEAAERLRARVASEAIKINGKNFNITVSIGVAARSARADKIASVEALINCADEALLHAKTKGRNKVYHY